MLHATLKSLLAQKLRLAMSAFAIVLGVAFVSGSFVFTDTLNTSFTDIFQQTAPDVTVRPAHAEAAATGGFTATDAGSYRPPWWPRWPRCRVSRADGVVADQSTYVIGKNGKAVSPPAGPLASRKATTTGRPRTAPRSSRSPQAPPRPGPAN